MAPGLPEKPSGPRLAFACQPESQESWYPFLDYRAGHHDRNEVSGPRGAVQDRQGPHPSPARSQPGPDRPAHGICARKCGSYQPYGKHDQARRELRADRQGLQVAETFDPPAILNRLNVYDLHRTFFFGRRCRRRPGVSQELRPRTGPRGQGQDPG